MRGVKVEVDWTQYDALKAKYPSRRKVAQAMGLSESTLRDKEKCRNAIVPIATTKPQGAIIVEDLSTTSSLSMHEQSTLETYERTIEAGLKTFLEVGNALLAIRDGKLYRATYATFEAYCQQRWELKQSRAYQLMDAAEVVETLKRSTSESSTIVELPANEAQARPLATLPPAAQVEVWREAVETAPASGITATHVAQTVKARAQQTVATPAQERSTIVEVPKAPVAKPAPQQKGPQYYEYMTGLPMSDAEADRRKAQTTQEIREALMDVVDVIPDIFLEDLWNDLSRYVDLEDSWNAKIDALFQRPELREEWGLLDDNAWDDDDEAECPDDMGPRAWQAEQDQARAARRAAIAAAHRAGTCNEECPFYHED
jgi:hypothetical protein